MLKCPRCGADIEDDIATLTSRTVISLGHKAGCRVTSIEEGVTYVSGHINGQLDKDFIMVWDKDRRMIYFKEEK